MIELTYEEGRELESIIERAMNTPPGTNINDYVRCAVDSFNKYLRLKNTVSKLEENNRDE